MTGETGKGIGAGGLVSLLSVCSILGMLGTSSFSALLPEFQQLWGLSNTAAGWISGIFFGGYVLGVPVLVGLTDRLDPRRIYVLSFGLTAAATLGYGFLADGFVSAFLFRALAGLGLAGTYMPGLKLMTDRIGAHPRQGRYVAYYTAGFSLGTAVSYPFSAEMAQWLGWRWAFYGAAAGAVAALALVLALVPPVRPEPSTIVHRRLFDFRPVFRNRPAMAFVWGYAGHAWELFALRSWLVAFLIHAQSSHGGGTGLSGASWLTTAIVMVSTLSSIYGAEAAARSDRRRIIGRVMIASVALSILTGFQLVAAFPSGGGALLRLPPRHHGGFRGAHRRRGRDVGAGPARRHAGGAFGPRIHRRLPRSSRGGRGPRPRRRRRQQPRLGPGLRRHGRGLGGGAGGDPEALASQRDQGLRICALLRLSANGV